MESPAFTVAVVLDPLLEAAGPIDIQFGLNVIYGRNGAGKTRLLDGVRNALAGVRGSTGTALLVRAARVDDVDDLKPYELQNSVTTMIARSIAAPTDFRHFKPGSNLSNQTLTPNRASELLDEYLIDRLPESGAARDWVLANRMFLMVPAGSLGAPAWDVWPVAEPGTPWVLAEEAALEAAFTRYNDEYGFHDDEDYDADKQDAVEERYAAAVEASTLFPHSDREVHPSTKPGYVWHFGPYSPIGYGYRSTAMLDSIVVSGWVDFGVDVVDLGKSVTEATATYLAASVRALMDPWNPTQRTSTKKIEKVATERAEALGEAVTARLRGALLDGPFASLRLTRPGERLYAHPFEWEFRRTPTGWRSVELEGLSRAERLWAERAILEAIHLAADRDGEEVRPRLYIYDEPEAALHRSAEAHMARALVEIARDPSAIVIAATHSPELLDASSANVIEIRRGPGSSAVHSLDTVSRESLWELGLNPSDLLRLTRIFLLVEGMHDEVLIKHFLSDRLRAARIDVIPIRGGARLPSTTDSRVLFDYTDAHVVALLDNTDSQRIDEIWSRAVQAAAHGDVSGAKSIVTGEIGYGDGEAQYLTTWLTRALDYGLASRLTPTGLEAADIIEYLPIERVVPRAASWVDLHERHAAERESRQGTPKGFKEWLSARFKVSFTEDALIAYASGLPVPQGFERLMKWLEAISAER